MKGKYLFKLLIFACVAVLFTANSCVTKKKKGEVSKLGKFYHNMTSEYNGYFNANELYNEGLTSLKTANEDNYAKIIELYDYISVPNPKIVNAPMDTAIEKVTRVATLHDKGDWVDDCYVLMAKAQYLKQDYERAEETLEYFESEFNPSNPYGKNFKKKKLSAKARKKIAEEKKKEQKKEREEKKKVKDKEREEKKETQEKERKERKESAEEARKEKKKSAEEQRKDRKKQLEQAKKDREKNKGKSKREARTDSTQIKKKLEIDPKGTKKSTNVKEEEKQPEEEKIEEEKISDDAKKKKEVKKKKDKTSYYEGLLWLARTYIRNQNYSGAEFLLKRIEEDAVYSKKVASELPVAYADLHIKQKEYLEAMPYLDQALKVSGRKNDKARYAYVAGQLLQMNKRYKEAGHYFSISKHKAKDFKLKFMSTLAEAKMNALGGGKSKEEVVAYLSKFLKETKYSDFKDQIYFSMAEIALEYDIAKGKEYFALSSANNKGNTNLKTEACYYLGEILLREKNYTQAKLYYDTTLVSLPKTEDRYFYVKNMATNLTSIANNVLTIERVDSLLAMGEMSDEDLKKIAKNRLEKEREAGVKANENATNPKTPATKSGPASAGSSSFFAYNARSVELGKTSFKLIWGDRKLEDNWRRKSKTFQSNEEEDKPAEQNGENASKDITESEYKRVLADVPKSASQKEQLKKEKEKALFELGKDYRDKLKEYQLSIETLDRLYAEHAGFSETAQAYFYSYLDYVDLGDMANATKYRQLLNSKYPNDKFTKIANDPNYIDVLNADANKLETYYNQSYEMFQKAEYAKVMARVQSAQEAFGKDNKLVAKFTLLNAMCLGALKGKEAYIKALQEVIVRYPKTNEETRAKEILRFLTGDGSAFNNINVLEVDNIFDVDAKARHFVAIVIMSYDADVLDQAKIMVSEYNKEFYRPENLQLGDQQLSQEEGTQIVLVRSFDGMEKALNYYKGIEKNKTKFITNVPFEVYCVTQSNYRKILQEHTHARYRVWHEKNYLSK